MNQNQAKRNGKQIYQLIILPFPQINPIIMSETW